MHVMNQARHKKQSNQPIVAEQGKQHYNYSVKPELGLLPSDTTNLGTTIHTQDMYVVILFNVHVPLSLSLSIYIYIYIYIYIRMLYTMTLSLQRKLNPDTESSFLMRSQFSAKRSSIASASS